MTTHRVRIDPHLAEWTVNAACRGESRAPFFDPLLYDYARSAFCSRCPVVDECAADAFHYEQNGGDRYGLYGGLSPMQRRWMQQGTRRSRSQGRSLS